jgi:hypothetical protein
MRDRHSPVSPAGARKGIALTLLDAGARLLQDAAPLRGFDVYIVGFHCARDSPEMQMEAHHFCRVVNDGLIQCVIFDGNTSDANLIGVEYIVSDWLFDDLPPAERAYWHPHNHEVLSGELVAPGLPHAAEKALMRRLLNSYGKTWHTWHTGRHDGRPGDDLPLGDPRLMWSFNRDGERDPALAESREAAMHLDVPRRRAERRDLAADAHPQHGVDLLRDRFEGTTPVPGVVDADAPEG